MSWRESPITNVGATLDLGRDNIGPLTKFSSCAVRFIPVLNMGTALLARGGLYLPPAGHKPVIAYGNGSLV